MVTHNLGGPHQWSNKFQKLVSIAIENAQKSTLQSRHGAILFNNKQVYQESCNQSGHRLGPYTVPALHAEAMVLKSLRKSDHNNRFNILVVRINHLGELAESKPCAMCIHMIRRSGINRVYYSTDHGNLCYIKANFLDETHACISRGLILMITTYGTNINLPLNKRQKRLIFLTKTWNTQKVNGQKNKQ